MKGSGQAGLVYVCNIIKRYIAERTNKAEVRSEEQSEKTDSCRENLWNDKTDEKAIKTETERRTERKGVCKLGWFMCKTKTVTSPPREGELAGTFLTSFHSDHHVALC